MIDSNIYTKGFEIFILHKQQYPDYGKLTLAHKICIRIIYDTPKKLSFPGRKQALMHKRSILQNLRKGASTAAGKKKGMKVEGKYTSKKYRLKIPALDPEAKNPELNVAIQTNYKNKRGEDLGYSSTYFPCVVEQPFFSLFLLPQNLRSPSEF